MTNKLKIFLTDLIHKYKSLANPFMPYGVGLIASYTNKY